VESVVLARGLIFFLNYVLQQVVLTNVFPSFSTFISTLFTSSKDGPWSMQPASCFGSGYAHS